MRSFAAAVARLDAEVDNHLGDFLFYDVNGILSAAPVRGTFSDPGDLQILGLDAALDQVGTRRRLEINATIVAQPTNRDRIRSEHPLVAGAVWKPTAYRRTRNGRYWLIDLSKVSA